MSTLKQARPSVSNTIVPIRQGVCSSAAISDSLLTELISVKQLIDSADYNSLTSMRNALAKTSLVVEALPDYQAVGMENLVDQLRHELKNIKYRNDGLNSINKLSATINVSRAWISKFRDGNAVCMNVMNRIACAFGISFVIDNYRDDESLTID